VGGTFVDFIFGGVVRQEGDAAAAFASSILIMVLRFIIIIWRKDN